MFEATQQRSNLGVALGLVLGLPTGLVVGAGWFDLPAVLAAETPACATEADLEARIVELEGVLVAAGAQVEVDASRRLAEEGAPVPWTDEVEAPFRPEAAEGSVRQVLDALGSGALHGIDCAEYPCVATVLSGPGDDWRNRFLGKLGSLGYDTKAPSRTSVLKGAPDVLTVALLPEGAERAVRLRAQHRVRERDRQAVSDQHVPTEGF